MLATVLTGAVVALDSTLVEVDIAAGGVPTFLIVGLPDAAVQEARERGLETVYVPAIDAREATLLGGVQVMPVPTLAALMAHVRGERPIEPAPEGADLAGMDDERPSGDLADIKGQEHARQGG
jgi:magnesium chelatase family protein